MRWHKYFEQQVYTSSKHCPQSTHQPSRLTCKIFAAVGIRQGTTQLALHQAVSSAMTAADIRQEISTTATPAIVSNILNISANILNSRFIQVTNIARRVHINHQDLQNTGSWHQARCYPASSPPSHFNCL